MSEPQSWSVMASQMTSAQLIRVYLDGSMGIGKTSMLNEIPTHSLMGVPVLKVFEPMKYWRYYFTDLVTTVNDTCDRRRRGEFSLFQSSMIVTALQSKFADPYLVFHERVSSKCHRITGTRGNPSLILILDRHPISATVCFPIARHLTGDCSLEMLISMIIRLPQEPPGCNLVIVDLHDEKEHVSRLSSRNRTGEKTDLLMLRALNAVYSCLVDTIMYANHICPYSKDEWESEWLDLPWFDTSLATTFINEPRTDYRGSRVSLHHTLLAIFKRRELCAEDGSLSTTHAWILWGLLMKLRNINVERFNITGLSTTKCVESFMDTMSERLVTHMSWNDAFEIEADVLAYNKEMAM